MTKYTDFKTGRQVNAKNKKEAREKLQVSHHYAEYYVGIKGYKDEQWNRTIHNWEYTIQPGTNLKITVP
mgnify:CR=1 FL=1